MTTLREYKHDNYAQFSDQHPECRKVLEYIELLASSSGTFIDDWNLAELLDTDGCGPLWEMDKRELNRIFWDKVKELESDQPTDAEIPESVTEQINKIAKQKTQQVLRQLQTQLDSSLRSAQTYAAQAEKAMVDVADRRLKIASINNETIPIKQEIQQIISTGFYKLIPEESHNGYLVFYTPEVVMDWVQRNEATPAPVNLGSFKVLLKVGEGLLQVNPLRNNRRDEQGYYHPYISGGGVCWGSEGGTVQLLMKEFKYGEVFEKLANLLQYFDVNTEPYRDLGTLAQYTQPDSAQVTPTPNLSGDVSCPECNSPNVSQDSDEDGSFYVCEECGQDWT